MRGAALLFLLGALGACQSAQPELFKAYCEDGTHVVATKQRVDSFCQRRRGLRQIEPYRPVDDAPVEG